MLHWQFTIAEAVEFRKAGRFRRFLLPKIPLLLIFDHKETLACPFSPQSFDQMIS